MENIKFNLYKNMTEKEKNIILFVGNVFNSNINDVRNFEKSQNRKFRTAVITSININLNEKYNQKGVEKRLDHILRCDTKNINEIKKIVNHIKDEIVAVFCYFEVWMPLYARMAKLFPELNMPSARSLEICHSKLETRKKLIQIYPEITPRFMLINIHTDPEAIAEKIGFPCMTKPVNLSKSRFVMRSDNPEELKSNLRSTFTGIEKVLFKLHYENGPKILAEEYMEGSMYSIDAYISPKGKIHPTPIVRVITGRDMGIDDFFNYCRIIPAGIARKEEKKAQKAAIKALEIIDVTSVTVHIELMRTKNGEWKIVELQTRPGGYRNEMLKLSYGIKHHENDLLNKMGKKLIMPRKLKSYAAVLEIFPEKEGRLISVDGLEKAKKMKSFVSCKQIKQKGEMCGYSRNGYTFVFQMVLSHKNEDIFNQDLAEMREVIKIRVE